MHFLTFYIEFYASLQRRHTEGKRCLYSVCFSGTRYVMECTGDQTKHLFTATHRPKFLALKDKEVVAVVGVELAELTLIYVITVSEEE